MRNLIKLILVFTFHHFIRSMWATYIFQIKGFVQCISKGVKNLYIFHLKKFNDLKNLSDLNNWFLSVYRYKTWNKKSELLNYNNSNIEFFTGDSQALPGSKSDNMAYYANKKLRKLGYRSYKIGIMNQLDTLHYDCMFMNAGKYVIFNYGNNIIDVDKNLCIVKLDNKYKNIWNRDLIYWKCYPLLEVLGPFITLGIFSLILFLITKLF